MLISKLLELTQRAWQRTKNRKNCDKSRGRHNVSRGKIGITRALRSRFPNSVLQYVSSGSDPVFSPERGYCHIWAIQVCAAVKGMVFKQFTLGKGI